MNSRVDEYDGQPRTIGGWFKDHPSTAVTLMVAAFSALAYAHDQRSISRDKPHWDKMHEHMRRSVTYSLESNRHLESRMALIARAAGVKDMERPPQLVRAEERVRVINERGD